MQSLDHHRPPTTSKRRPPQTTARPNIDHHKPLQHLIQN